MVVASLMLIVGVIGLIVAFQAYRNIEAQPSGNECMQDIAASIREGAITFLKREAVYLLCFIAAAFLLLWIFIGSEVAIAYVVGSFCSLAAGACGMTAATSANVRTTQAASENNPGAALLTAFNGGSVMGLCVASLGIVGLGILFLAFNSPEAAQYLVGFGMGASSVALFARVGGGIYTKAADVGADLVGKVEVGIPEDDPRNPGVIADNVGDNVGDVAGMGADIFESYVGSMIACMAIGATIATGSLAEITGFEAGASIDHYKSWLMVTPFFMGVVGLILLLDWNSQHESYEGCRACRCT